MHTKPRVGAVAKLLPLRHAGYASPVVGHVMQQLQQLGAVLKPVEPLLASDGGYFKDSLTKLRVFELVEYDKVTLVDQGGRSCKARCRKRGRCWVMGLLVVWAVPSESRPGHLCRLLSNAVRGVAFLFLLAAAGDIL